jgi:RimJ/RimL family protein N-acetyltransferase
MVDPLVNQFLETRFIHPTIHSLREYIFAMRESSHSYLFGIFMSTDGQHVGNIKLGPLSSVHASAAIGLLLGERGAWGKGIASEAIGVISEWALDKLGLEKLNAGSYGQNAGSIRAFEKNGFHIEGVQRRQVRLPDGSRDDVILLGKTRLDVG